MKHFLKLAAAAAVAVTSVFVPTDANAADNYDLIKYLEANGVIVNINSEPCYQNAILGRCRFNKDLTFGEMTLCPGKRVDGHDHDTVIHESMHVVQACVNKRRGTPYVYPAHSFEELTKRVNSTLSKKEVQWIKDNYPQPVWWVEFEAFYAEDVYDADDMIRMLGKYCF